MTPTTENPRAFMAIKTMVDNHADTFGPWEPARGDAETGEDRGVMEQEEER